MEPPAQGTAQEDATVAVTSPAVLVWPTWGQCPTEAAGGHPDSCWDHPGESGGPGFTPLGFQGPMG